MSEGKSEWSTGKRAAFVIAALLVLAVALPDSANETLPVAPAPAPRAVSMREKSDLYYENELAVLSADWARTEYGSTVVRGIVENRGGPKSYASIHVNFTDAESGAVVQSGLDNIASLGAGARWQFEVLMTYNGRAYYEITGLSSR